MDGITEEYVRLSYEKFRISSLGVDEYTTNSVTAWHFCRQNCNSSVGTGIIFNGIDFKIAQKLPCNGRPTNQMFQSCYDVGCPVAVTSISGVKQQVYIIQGTFVSWHEGVFKNDGLLVYICRRSN
jgi:hypothetical protein